MEPKSGFPVFRKYPNDMSYFKINSQSEFEQLIISGQFYRVDNVEAKQYPEKVLIEDMIRMRNNYWTPVSEEEFSQRLNFCQENLENADD